MCMCVYMYIHTQKYMNSILTTQPWLSTNIICVWYLKKHISMASSSTSRILGKAPWEANQGKNVKQVLYKYTFLEIWTKFTENFLTFLN